MSQATTPRAMAAAAPQLPGQLQNVDHFRPFRSAMLGFGMFAMNPLGVSSVITAALGIVLADLAGSPSWTAVSIFVLLSCVSVILLIVVVQFTGATARTALHRIRGWVSGHHGYVNAAVFLFVALVQFDRGFESLQWPADQSPATRNPRWVVVLLMVWPCRAAGRYRWQ